MARPRVKPRPLTADNADVALEDRDWYREHPSDEWVATRRSSTRWNSSRTEPVAGWDDHDAPSGDTASSRVPPGALLAILVSAAAIAVTAKFDPIELLRPAPSAPPAPMVDLGTDPRLDQVATAETRWTFSTPRTGAVQVVVPIGMTPRQAFIRELSVRGLQVAP